MKEKIRSTNRSETVFHHEKHILVSGHITRSGRAMAQSLKRSYIDGNEVSSSWRPKCILRFNLSPVPKDWSDAVATGTEDAWGRCFEYRTREEAVSAEYGKEDEYGDEHELEDHMETWEDSRQCDVEDLVAQTGVATNRHTKDQ